MSSKKTLPFKLRFVQNLNQVLTDRFDEYPLLPDLPFTNMGDRHALTFRLNQDEYTKMYSALSIGAELMFPDESHELMYIFEAPLEYSQAEDTCQDYTMDSEELITFAPQNPYTEPDTTPAGYLMPPFWIVGDLVPEFLPDWFAELITDIIEQFTGYEDDDILTTIGSFPLLANWADLLTNGLPRVQIDVSGSGRLLVHFLNVPFGGRALVSVDTEFDPVDIIEGIITGGFKLVELERDYSSIPPELDVDNIEEIVIEGAGEHVVYITFLPVVDITAFPLKFGGGFRKVTWCPDNIPDEECPECPECPEPTIEDLLSDDEFFQDEYIPQVFGDKVSGQAAKETELTTAYDGTPQSIGGLIPTAAPNPTEKNALCYAINKFVSLYCSQKVCTIQAKNFLQIAWNDYQNLINDVYNQIVDWMVIYTPNIFSCFVDDDEALTVLPDEAAQEELGCFLYDELSSVTMSQSNFDDALLAAVMTLSDNAQKIACIMNQDNATSLYLHFLEAYNVALQKQDADCPCEAPDTYWMKVWDFSFGSLGWQPVPTSNAAEYAGSYWTNRTSNPPNSNWCYIYTNFDMGYVIKACGIDWEAGGRTGQNGDGERAEGFKEIGTGGGGNFTDSTNGTGLNGRNITNFRDPAEAQQSQSYACRVSEAGTLTGGRFSRIHRVVLYGLPNAGSKPSGSVWVSSIPASPASLFP